MGEIINEVSKFLDINPQLLSNVIFSLACLIFYLFARFFARKYMKRNFPDNDLSEEMQEIVPSVIRLIFIGFLVNIWFSGKASVASFFSIDEQTTDKFVASVFSYLAYLGLSMLSDTVLTLKVKSDNNKQFNWRRSFSLFMRVSLGLVLAKIWIVGSADLSTYLGLVSAGLAIALQDIIVSFVGWVYLVTIKPFGVGDRVQIGQQRGDVCDIGILQFSIQETGNWVNADQATGRILTFPNAFIFKNSIANYNAGFEFIFTELPVMVTFESDWKKAKQILTDILRDEVGPTNPIATKQIKKASRTQQLNFVHLDPRVITSVADSGVVLTMRFLVMIFTRRQVEDKVWCKILEEFAKHNDIDFAYPSYRIYQNNLEGKSGAGGPK